MSIFPWIASEMQHTRYNDARGGDFSENRLRMTIFLRYLTLTQKISSFFYTSANYYKSADFLEERLQITIFTSHFQFTEKRTLSLHKNL